MIQRYRWASNGQFFTRVGLLQDVSRCLSDDLQLQSVQHITETIGRWYDYICLTKQIIPTPVCPAAGEANCGVAPVNELRQDSAYESVSRAAALEIFAVRR